MDHTGRLNKEQQKAASHRDGALLIVAGAGAGKTRVLTHRILSLIKNGVSPSEILAITFTNKAAKEMSERMEHLLHEDSTLNIPVSFSEKPFMSTFHSLGVHILREQYEKIGVSKHFVIMDDSDTQSIIKEVLKNLSLDPKQFEPRRIKNVISKNKGNLITVDKYAADAGNEYFPKIVASVWGEYEKLLHQQNGFDFDDLLIKTTLLLKNDAGVRTYYQNKWKYIHIDEYQDTNIAQYELSKLLAGDTKNICVVGDMDQSIYSWRGADFRNILNFEKDFPKTEVILLEENYRSSANILEAANSIIKKNKIRKDKKLFTQKEAGEKIGLFAAYDEVEEAQFVAEKSMDLIRQGVSPKDIAVLYRANFQSRALEESFLEKNIPYQVLGVKFFERKEIKDMLAFLRAALNQENINDIKRIINVPPRGIGKATLAKIAGGQAHTLSPAMQKKVGEFYGILSQIKEYSSANKVSETVKFLIRKTGVEARLRSGIDEDKERLENIYELVSLAKKYDILTPEEGTQKLLEDAALASDQDSLGVQKKKEEDAVRLMTVHSSKGLEFPYVFITGLEQDLFPHIGIGSMEFSEEKEEEERRLFYVAITRAQEKAFLTYSSVRTIFGSKQVNVPSEFIIDIDETLLEEESMPEYTIIVD